MRPLSGGSEEGPGVNSDGGGGKKGQEWSNSDGGGGKKGQEWRRDHLHGITHGTGRTGGLLPGVSRWLSDRAGVYKGVPMLMLCALSGDSRGRFSGFRRIFCLHE